MELAVPAWHPGLTQSDSLDIKTVQRAATNIILESNFKSYKSALGTLHLDSLAERREALCLKFGKKTVKHEKHANWFKLNKNVIVMRQARKKFCPVIARTKKFQDSPIS